MPNSNYQLAEAWYKKAYNDLRNALYVIKMADPPLDTICYHAHQAGEKFIKGYLIETEQKFPFIHDLNKLLVVCIARDGTFKKLEKAAAFLTPYSTQSRYPDEDYDFSLAETKSTIKYAQAIATFILNKTKTNFVMKSKLH